VTQAKAKDRRSASKRGEATWMQRRLVCAVGLKSLCRCKGVKATDASWVQTDVSNLVRPFLNQGVMSLSSRGFENVQQNSGCHLEVQQNSRQSAKVQQSSAKVEDVQQSSAKFIKV
jgi:hypothetical protein